MEKACRWEKEAGLSYLTSYRKQQGKEEKKEEEKEEENREKKQEVRQGYKTSRTDPSDLLPAARFCLQKVA